MHMGALCAIISYHLLGALCRGPHWRPKRHCGLVFGKMVHAIWSMPSGCMVSLREGANIYLVEQMVAVVRWRSDRPG